MADSGLSRTVAVDPTLDVKDPSHFSRSTLYDTPLRVTKQDGWYRYWQA